MNAYPKYHLKYKSTVKIKDSAQGVMSWLK